MMKKDVIAEDEIVVIDNNQLNYNDRIDNLRSMGYRVAHTNNIKTNSTTNEKVLSCTMIKKFYNEFDYIGFKILNNLKNNRTNFFITN